MCSKRKALRLLLYLACVFPAVASCERVGPELPFDDGCDYLCFTAAEAGSTISIACVNVGYGFGVDTVKGPIPQKIEYSTDRKEWKRLQPGVTVTLASVDDRVYLRGINPDRFNIVEDNPVTGNSQGQMAIFQMTGKIAASGNIMSLIDGKGETCSLPQKEAGCFAFLFNMCDALVSAPDLPATELTEHCYECMFQGCTSLQKAPALPAVELADWCYCSMFSWTSLESAPALPALKLAANCYAGMFSSCVALQSSPELPATGLAEQCYCMMFSDCLSLQSAPEVLPATELAPRCYRQMFTNCFSLVSAPALPAMTLAPECYSLMFSECHSLK